MTASTPPPYLRNATQPTPLISRTTSAGQRRIRWTAQADALLGTATDNTIAAQLGVTLDAVNARRRKLGIATFSAGPLAWTAEMEALLGTDTDPAIAKRLGVNAHQVRFRRQQLGIGSAQLWSQRLRQEIARQNPPPMPHAVLVAATNRFFLIDQPALRTLGSTLFDTEDKELTAYLQRELEQVQSLSLHPCACPRCGSRQTALKNRPDAYSRRPTFKCKSCRRRFNRLTGTPLARLHYPELMPEFIRLLSQQVPYEEASRRLGLDYNAVQNWAKKFRLWLLQLDPSGQWEARVRLGIKPRAHIRCPRCGDEGGKQFSGKNGAGERRLTCFACGGSFNLRDAERLAQQQVRLEIRHDPGKVKTTVKDD